MGVSRSSSVSPEEEQKLEEVDCSLQVVEQQFVRSISNDLKESIIDYIYTLHSTSRKLNDVCEDFIECMNSLGF